MKWLCDYNMAWYPFDTQLCTMEFRSNYCVPRIPCPKESRYAARRRFQDFGQDILDALHGAWLTSDTPKVELKD